MNEQVKRRSILMLESLEECADNMEAVANEVVRMVIRGDDNRQVPAVLRGPIDVILSAVNDIKSCVLDISAYVNRRQETHRL